MSDTFPPPPPFPASRATTHWSRVGYLRGNDECPEAKTDGRLRKQGEELARHETYALDVDFPGRAMSMSARGFTTRQRDHRRDRGKPVPNDVVNDVSVT